MNYTTLQVQTRLKQLGFDPGNLDGPRPAAGAIAPAPDG